MSTHLRCGLATALLLILIGGTPRLAAQPTPLRAPDSTTTAVPDGALVIVGGGSTKAIHRRFVELAGGDEAEVVCVPTAHPHGRMGGWCRRLFRRAGVDKAQRTVLHTRDPATADSEAFVEPLRSADAVWFTGGRQWRLVEAYAGTKAYEAFWDVLERGGVIGGSSAGASIQGSFLVRGDPKSKRILVGEYTEGFGFLPQSAIDQHVGARGRTYDLLPIIEARPHLLGIGIDEGTAAIVQGDTLRVMGTDRVVIHDARRWAGAADSVSAREKVLFLRSGDRFDLRTRSVLPASDPQK
jgi:cyanophycinase